MTLFAYCELLAISLQVGKIAKTFESHKHYFSSYIYPLIEETHADLNSNMSLLYQAPTCEILHLEENKDYKPPKQLFYDAVFDRSEDRKTRNKRDTYVPQKGDVIALTERRPRCIDDLNMPPRHYLLALVTRGDGEDSPFLPQILTSKPVFREKAEEGEGKWVSLIATFLINITTNDRIWTALKGGKNLGIIKEVLSADSTVSFMIYCFDLFIIKCKKPLQFRLH